MARRAARLPAEARREEILKAASECFQRAGYHETTIDDIALAAGLSKGAVYWHFEAKRDLFLALVDSFLRELEGELTPPEGASARESLVHMSEVGLGMDPSGPGWELMIEFMAHAARDEVLRRRVFEMGEGAIEAIVATIERGVKSGEFRAVDPGHVALGFAAILDGLKLHQVLRPELDISAAWRETVDLLLRGLEAS